MPRKKGPPLTVIVPTIGRQSLITTLNSIATQPRAYEVEVIVVADTHGRRVPFIPYKNLDGELYDYIWLNHDAGFNCWGHPQRNFAMPYATGRYIVSLDDDDTWDPTALEAVLDATAEREPHFHIFKMKYTDDGHELWVEPKLVFGNVGTPMMVVPNDVDKLGSWGRVYEGDFFFLQMTVANMGEASVAWHDKVIAHIRPPGNLRD